MNNNHPTWSLDPKALIEGQGEGASRIDIEGEGRVREPPASTSRERAG
jgi:hypothetical protein